MTRVRRYSALVLALTILISTASPASAVSWGPVQPITASGQAFAWSGATATYTGGMAVAYRETVNGVNGVYIRRSIDGGTTWTNPRRLSSANAVGASRGALAAGGSTIHAAFMEERSDGSSKVVYRRSTDGGVTWLTPVPLSPNGARVGFPSVARDGQGRVVVAWTNEGTGKVSVRVSTDGGASFAARTDIATTISQPWLGDGFTEYEAFPAVAIADGRINVAYYSSGGTLRLRRSSTNGGSWTTALTLATNGSGYYPRLVASGRTILVGYAIYTGSDIYTAYRRSTTAGQSWSAAAALSGASAPPSFQPAMSVKGGTWRVAFERCIDEDCTQSDVYYRQSTDGTSWSAASRVTNGPGDYQGPVGVQFGSAINVWVNTIDATTDATDVLLRQGS